MAQLWPLPLHLASSVLGPSGGIQPTDGQLGDTMLSVSALGSVARLLVSQPAHLFDVNMYYPFRPALAAIDHQLSNALIAAPFTLAFGSPLIGYNVLIIASFVACAYGAFLLAHALTGSAAAGLVAGVVYAFSPFRIEHMHQSHVLAGFWLPFLFLAVHRFLDRPTHSRLALVVLLFVLQALASWYYATIAAVGVVTVGIFELARRSGPYWPLLLRAGGAGAVAALAILPAAVPYVTLSRSFVEQGRRSFDVMPSEPSSPSTAVAGVLERRSTGGVLAEGSAQIQGYLAAVPQSRAPWIHPFARFGLPEARFFPGFVALALSGIALITRVGARPRRRETFAVFLGILAIVAVPSVCAGLGFPAAWPIALVRQSQAILVAFFAILAWTFYRVRERTEVRQTQPGSRPRLGSATTYAMVALVAWMFSLGPDVRAFDVPLGAGIYPGGWPPFNLLRVPARFASLWTLAIAILAGYGLAFVLPRIRSRRAGTIFIAAVLIVASAEQVNGPFSLTSVPPPSRIHRWLADHPGGAVVEFPIHANVWPLYWAWFHQHPLVNGSGVVDPVAYARLRSPDNLSLPMLDHLRTYLHPRYLVLDTALYEPHALTQVLANVDADGDALRRIDVAGRYQLFEVGEHNRATRLLRAYPAWMLKDTQGIAISGTIGSGGPGRHVTIGGWLNGQRLASWPAEQFQPDQVLSMPLPRVDTRVANIEFVSDYTVDSSAERPLIGSTGRTAPADISVSVDRVRSVTRVNGLIWLGAKGYTLVVLAPDGTVSDVRNFNTSWYDADSASMASYIRGLPDGRIVLLASAFDASRALTPDAVAALRTLGLSGDLRGKFQWAHAAIGVKGAPPGSAAESIGEERAACKIGEPSPVEFTVSDIHLY